jgi:DNA-binding NtrC family response regulator
VSPTRVDTTRAGEILVVDGSESVRRGLGRLLKDAGLVVTSVAEPERARDQIANRFFALALVDLDTPRTGAGLDLLPFAKATSPLTAIVIMAGQPTFDAAAAAFRAGAVDVVPKTKEALPYLRQKVIEAAAKIRTTVAREQLLGEAADLHEQFLREMMQLSRQVIDLEERLRAGGDTDTDADATPVGSGLDGPLDVLIVDDDHALPERLRQDLLRSGAWRVRTAGSGGEALDAASQRAPHVLVVKSTLPDLPGSMVLKTVKTTRPELVGILFTPPRRDQAGEVRLMEGSNLLTIVPSWSDPAQLFSSLEELREALRKKAGERRYLQAFRKRHLDFLKRYHQLRQRLSEPPG